MVFSCLPRKEIMMLLFFVSLSITQQATADETTDFSRAKAAQDRNGIEQFIQDYPRSKRIMEACMILANLSLAEKHERLKRDLIRMGIPGDDLERKVMLAGSPGNSLDRILLLLTNNKDFESIVIEEQGAFFHFTITSRESFCLKMHVEAGYWNIASVAVGAHEIPEQEAPQFLALITTRNTMETYLNSITDQNE